MKDYAEYLKGYVGKKGEFSTMEGGIPYISFGKSYGQASIKEVHESFVIIDTQGYGIIALPLNFFALIFNK